MKGLKAPTCTTSIHCATHTCTNVLTVQPRCTRLTWMRNYTLREGRSRPCCSTEKVTSGTGERRRPRERPRAAWRSLQQEKCLTSGRCGGQSGACNTRCGYRPLALLALLLSPRLPWNVAVPCSLYNKLSLRRGNTDQHAEE